MLGVFLSKVTLTFIVIAFYCSLINNSASDSSTIFAFNNLLSLNSFSYYLFLGNTATANLINLMYTRMEVKDNTRFVDNVA